MAQNNVARRRDVDVINDNVREVKSVADDDFDPSREETGCENIPECPVCLQNCIHPVRLPCQHIFCFLCVKGAANQSKRCALCRQEIPVDFLNNPALLRKDDLLKDGGYSEDGFSWFYEGRNGWWQYDERTSQELEERYKRDIKVFDLLIAGFLYVIDLDNMLQIRRNDPTRRRRIKRDSKDVPKKGVAGLKINEASPRDGADGIDSDEQGNNSTNANVMPRRQLPDPNTTGNDRSTSTPHRSGTGSPTAPHNTPQSPSTEGSPNREQSQSDHQGEEVSARMADMSLGPDREARSSVGSIPQLGSPTSSSDSDWD